MIPLLSAIDFFADHSRCVALHLNGMDGLTANLGDGNVFLISGCVHYPLNHGRRWRICHDECFLFDDTHVRRGMAVTSAF